MGYHNIEHIATRVCTDKVDMPGTSNVCTDKVDMPGNVCHG